MSITSGTVKILSFISNVLWTIAGILVILFGALGWGAMPLEYAISCIVFGIIILTTSFFGCFGTVRESARLLWTCAAFLLVLFVLVITFKCLGTHDVFRRFALRGVDEAWEKELKNAGGMDHIQTVYHCCGRNSADDYIKLERNIPSSCCKDGNCINPLNLYYTGCIEQVQESFADEARATNTVLWTLIGLDILLLTLSSALAIYYNNRKRRFNY